MNSAPDPLPETSEMAMASGEISRERLINPDEGLIRRAFKTPKKWSPVEDQLTGALRAPAIAFEPRLPDPQRPDKKVDEAVSINVQSSLERASLPLTWGVDPIKQYAARITVSDCLTSALEAWHEPVCGNPHHGQIWGLVEMFSADPDKYERTIDALAKASTIVPNADVLTL